MNNFDAIRDAFHCLKSVSNPYATSNEMDVLNAAEDALGRMEKQNTLLVEALEQFRYAYPYEPPCHDWEAKALAHQKAKKALAAIKENK